jgi:integrase/recombinase XerD
MDNASIRHRPSALAALFECLCDRNAVPHNPVKGVARLKSETGEGKTHAVGDHQARKLLDAPDGNRSKFLRRGRLSDKNDSTRNKRDRAILSTLLFHALRREELCKLKVRDYRHARKGVPHLKVSGKGGKRRYLPLHPGTHALIQISRRSHGEDDIGALFRPIRNNTTAALDKAITPDGIYKLARAYSTQLGFEIGAHALRATIRSTVYNFQCPTPSHVSSITPRAPRRGDEHVARRRRSRLNIRTRYSPLALLARQ